MNAAGLWALGRDLVSIVRREQLTFLAAAIAYYAFVSIVPLLMIGLAVAATLGGPSLQTELAGALEGVLTPEAASLVQEGIQGGAGRGSATVVGLLVLTWSGIRLFRGLDVAFGRIYGVGGRSSLLTQFRDALVTLVAVGVGVLATVALAAALPLARVPLAVVSGPLLLTGVLSVLFLPVYVVLPAPELRLREVVPGAVLAGTGWALLATVFGVYVDLVGGSQVYGLLGAVLLVLTWLYVGGLIVLLGAALNATVEERRLDRQLQQEPGRRSARPATMSGREDGDDGDAGAGASESDDPADHEPAGPPRSDGGRPVDADPDPDGDASGDDGSDGGGSGGDPDDGSGSDPADVSPMDVETADPEEVERLRRRVESFEEDIEDRTVHRADLEADLKRYVRGRMRRGHARGWGPYLVLLYGTAMTLGAFYYLEGIWAVLAMVVVWLSTLGLYALMLVVGVTATALGLPRRLLDRVRDFR